MSAQLPLAGVRVADFTHVFAGPFCTMTLADMGAEVIKVEPPRGDATRSWQPPSVGGESASFLCMNRNKRGIVLNLQQEDARIAARDLVAGCDVLVENFATGVMERLGLGYETLAALNPRLVYCSISAYGRDGALAQRAGYDAVVQAETGIMSLNGHAGGDPHKIPLPVVDLATGMFATQAILAALMARGQSGQGQFIDVPLYDTAVNLTSFMLMGFLASGIDPQRIGNHSPVVGPVDLFDTAGGGQFFMNIASEGVWDKLVGVLGGPPELRVPDYAKASARVRNKAPLKAVLNSLFAARPLEHWLEALRAAGVPAGPVMSIGQAAASQEMRERGLIGQAPHTTLGTVPNLRLPMRMAGTPLRAPQGAPTLGEHTAQVLGELGYDAARIARIEAQGVAAAPS